MLKPTTDSPWYYAGVAVGIIVIAFGALAFQAWLIGVVLGWFGVNLGFWKCFLIAFLLGTLFGSSRSSR